MAQKTVTIDTGEWVYIDKFGDGHTVTNAQTFTFTLTDGGPTAVTYYIDQAQSITTTDGYRIVFRPQVETSNSNSAAFKIGLLADTSDATKTYSVKGEMVCECPKSHDIQRWTIAEMTINDIDAPTAITAMKFEDQFGNVMNIPNTGGGITVA